MSEEKPMTVGALIENQIGWITVNIRNLRLDHPNNPPDGSWQKKCVETRLSCLEEQKLFLEILRDKIV